MPSLVVGQRVIALDGEDEGGWTRADEPWLRLIRMRLDKAEGGWVDITMLWHIDDVTARSVIVGGFVRIDQPEMGAVGMARVSAVEPSPRLEEGKGRLIISTYRHSSAVVGDWVVEGEPEPIGVTPWHPVWSEDRQAYIAVAELREGERLQGSRGKRPRVVSYTLRAQPEPVYNIEVDGDHCYRVGQQGLLVHNTSPSPGETPVGKPEAGGCCELGEATVSSAVQDFSGTKLLSPAVLNENKALIPLSPKSKAISSDSDGHVYIVGAEIPPKHIGASKHTEVFGEGVVIRITQQLLGRIMDIIKTQAPTYEIKAGNSVLRSAQANTSHAEVQAIVSYLDNNSGQRGNTVKVTVSQAPCDYSCRRGVLQILADYYHTTLVVYFPDGTDTYTPKCPSAAK